MKSMKKRILVVDDAAFMRNLIKDVLVKAHYEVCGEASNAMEGVAKYKELRPDLVTFDIVMPRMEEMDGISAVKEILYVDPKANVVVVSALGEKRLIQEALSYGAKDYIIKPFTAEKLVHVVANIIGEGEAAGG